MTSRLGRYRRLERARDAAPGEVHVHPSGRFGAIEPPVAEGAAPVAHVAAAAAEDARVDVAKAARHAQAVAELAHAERRHAALAAESRRPLEAYAVGRLARALDIGPLARLPPAPRVLLVGFATLGAWGALVATCGSLVGIVVAIPLAGLAWRAMR